MTIDLVQEGELLHGTVVLDVCSNVILRITVSPTAMYLALQTSNETVAESVGAVTVELVVVKGEVDQNKTLRLMTDQQTTAGYTAHEGGHGIIITGALAIKTAAPKH